MSATGARGAIHRQYLTRSEVARLFEVSPATIARWTREGKLPFVRTLGGQRRYERGQVIDLMRGCLGSRSIGKTVAEGSMTDPRVASHSA